MTLRDRLIEWKLAGRKIEGGYRFYTNEVAADRALAALGLDDPDAAVERANIDHPHTGLQIGTDCARAVLEAALLATEGGEAS